MQNLIARVIVLLKKSFSVFLCVCLACFFFAGCGKTNQPPLLNGDDPDATLAPTDPPEVSPADNAVRNGYATQQSPLPYEQMGTFNGIAWQIDKAPYVFDLSVSGTLRGQQAKDALSEGTAALPELAADEELVLVRFYLNLTQCQDSDAMVEFSALSVSFMQPDGSLIYQCPVLGKDDAGNLYPEGRFVETTLIGKAKKEKPFVLVFQPEWGQGFWMATE